MLRFASFRFVSRISNGVFRFLLDILAVSSFAREFWYADGILMYVYILRTHLDYLWRQRAKILFLFSEIYCGIEKRKRQAELF